MKITFPHMGNTYISIKALFDDLGVETVVPPPCSKKTLEIGTKHAPELICLPLKINMGNYIESIEQGADTIVITGSCGPCRYGYYSEVQKEILKDLGYDVEVVVLEAPEGNMKEFYHRVSKIANTKNIVKIAKCLRNAAKVLNKLNQMEDFILSWKPYEIKKGEMDKIYQYTIAELEKSYGSSKMSVHLDLALEHLRQVPLDKERDILKIGVVGEIYTVIEDFANFDIGRKLNDLGISVRKSHTAGGWLKEHLVYRSLGMTGEMEIRKAAAAYLPDCIGGHARETVGHTVLFGEKHFDGVVHVLPFTCMPEIISMSLMPMIQEEKNIPVLSLIIDEMTGEAGYVTRLEAFVDLLKNRRESLENEKILSWH
ncbi:MAG: CoA protein activase [Bacillota bacterium]